MGSHIAQGHPCIIDSNIKYAYKRNGVPGLTRLTPG